MPIGDCRMAKGKKDEMGVSLVGLGNAECRTPIGEWERKSGESVRRQGREPMGPWSHADVTCDE